MITLLHLENCFPFSKLVEKNSFSNWKQISHHLPQFFFSHPNQQKERLSRKLLVWPPVEFARGSGWLLKVSSLRKKRQTAEEQKFFWLEHNQGIEGKRFFLSSRNATKLLSKNFLCWLLLIWQKSTDKRKGNRWLKISKPLSSCSKKWDKLKKLACSTKKKGFAFWFCLFSKKSNKMQHSFIWFQTFCFHLSSIHDVSERKTWFVESALEKKCLLQTNHLLKWKLL